MPKVDDVNGLVFIAIKWIANAGLLSRPQLEQLEGLLKQHAAHYDGADSVALRCFATAVHSYMIDEDNKLMIKE